MTPTRRAALAAPALLLARPLRAQAPGFPARAVRMVVPYSPGGVSDITARLIAEPLSAAWGQPVPVENRGGADGIIGTEVVAKSAPDGHTLALVSVGHPVNAAFYRLPYDTMRDFSFVTMTTRTPLVIIAARGFPASTPAELVARAKEGGEARPVSFAAAGGVVRLAPLLFAQRAGIRMTDITYRGSTQAHPDIIAGRVDIMFDTVPAALPQIQAGTLKALATTGAERAPQLPDVPTLGEAFMPGFEASTWGMVIGPAGIPGPVLERLSDDIGAAVTRPDVVARHATLGAAVVRSAPEETRRFVAAELEKWGEAARRAGIQPRSAG